MTMQRPLRPRHEHALLARSVAVELGAQLCGRRVAHDGEGGLDALRGNDLRRAARFGTGGHASGPAAQRDPALDRCLADLEALCDLGVAFVARLVRPDDTDSKLDMVGFSQSPPDQQRSSIQVLGSTEANTGVKET